MTTLPITLPLHHVNCRHRQYLMTCDEFDLLHGDGRCNICGADELWVLSRYKCPLYIDHWGGRPNWQVRGLLCLWCNTKLEDGNRFNAAAGHYLDNSYWRRVLAPQIPDVEPASGVAQFRWRKVWHRHADGWRPTTFKNARKGPYTWRELCENDGPPISHAATTASS